MYRVGYDNNIEEVEVERTTEHSVWFYRTDWLTKKKNEHITREVKKCSYHTFYDTPKEAKDAVINAQAKSIESLKKKIAYAEEYILRAKNYKPKS